MRAWSVAVLHPPPAWRGTRLSGPAPSHPPHLTTHRQGDSNTDIGTTALYVGTNLYHALLILI